MDGRLDAVDHPPGPSPPDRDEVAVCCLDNEGREDTRRRVVLAFEVGAEVQRLSLHPADAKGHLR